MIRITIVENSHADFIIIRNNILRFGRECGIKFDITRFTCGLDFLSNYKRYVDIVFLRADLPQRQGYVVGGVLYSCGHNCSANEYGNDRRAIFKTSA